jgi:D-alanyl-D-alanine carboxypeptidase
MNDRARKLGCTNTRFNNPHGLKDPAHYTSARDLGLIAREALLQPEICQAVCTQKRFIARDMNQEDLLMVNHNKLLKYDPTVKGVKTGYTVPAGKCFVGARDVGDLRIITVVLASQDWVKDTKALFAWAMKLKRQAVWHKGQIVNASVSGKSIRAKVKDDVTVTCYRDGVPRAAIRLLPDVHAPISPGDVIGYAEASSSFGKTVSIPIVADEEIRSGVDGMPASIAAPGAAIVLLLAYGGSRLSKRSKRNA